MLCQLLQQFVTLLYNTANYGDCWTMPNYIPTYYYHLLLHDWYRTVISAKSAELQMQVLFLRSSL